MTSHRDIDKIETLIKTQPQLEMQQEQQQQQQQRFKANNYNKHWLNNGYNATKE